MGSFGKIEIVGSALVICKVQILPVISVIKRDLVKVFERNLSVYVDLT